MIRYMLEVSIPDMGYTRYATEELVMLESGEWQKDGRPCSAARAEGLVDCWLDSQDSSPDVRVMRDEGYGWETIEELGDYGKDFG